MSAAASSGGASPASEAGLASDVGAGAPNCGTAVCWDREGGRGGEGAGQREGMSAIRLSMVTAVARKHGLGTIDPAAWELVARDLTAAGLYTTAPDYASAYTTKFPSGVRP